MNADRVAVVDDRHATRTGVASGGTLTPVTLELDFNEAMVELYRRAKREIHYTAPSRVQSIPHAAGATLPSLGSIRLPGVHDARG